jgi:hypothetical protein
MLHTGLQHSSRAAKVVPADTYLTDGTRLFRVLEQVGHTQAMVTVEDCHTLDVMLIARDAAHRLRQVRVAGFRRPADG